MSLTLVGVDIETTGLDPSANHRLIQIGIVLPGGTKICYDVKPYGYMNFTKKALEVNGFTMERIEKGTPQADVDTIISTQLRKQGWTDADLTPVGFNVGAFDMRFIHKELPKTARFFSHRVLDLTGVAIMHELRTGHSYRDLKDEMHAKVVERLGRDQRHDALYDAEAAMVIVDLFKEMK